MVNERRKQERHLAGIHLMDEVAQRAVELSDIQKPRYISLQERSLPCGHAKNYCTDCREIFSNDNCQWGILKWN